MSTCREIRFQCAAGTCKLTPMRLNANPRDAVRWEGSQDTGGTATFSHEGWPFLEPYQSSLSVQAGGHTLWFTVKDAHGEYNYDHECASCEGGQAKTGAKIIIE
jgi:plastocyanin